MFQAEQRLQLPAPDADASFAFAAFGATAPAFLGSSLPRTVRGWVWPLSPAVGLTIVCQTTGAIAEQALPEAEVQSEPVRAGTRTTSHTQWRLWRANGGVAALMPPVELAGVEDSIQSPIGSTDQMTSDVSLGRLEEAEGFRAASSQRVADAVGEVEIAGSLSITASFAVRTSGGDAGGGGGGGAGANGASTAAVMAHVEGSPEGARQGAGAEAEEKEDAGGHGMDPVFETAPATHRLGMLHWAPIDHDASLSALGLPARCTSGGEMPVQPAMEQSEASLPRESRSDDTPGLTTVNGLTEADTTGGRRMASSDKRGDGGGGSGGGGGGSGGGFVGGADGADPAVTVSVPQQIRLPYTATNQDQQAVGAVEAGEDEGMAGAITTNNPIEKLFCGTVDGDEPLASPAEPAGAGADSAELATDSGEEAPSTAALPGRGTSSACLREETSVDVRGNPCTAAPPAAAVLRGVGESVGDRSGRLRAVTSRAQHGAGKEDGTVVHRRGVSPRNMPATTSAGGGDGGGANGSGGTGGGGGDDRGGGPATSISAPSLPKTDTGKPRRKPRRSQRNLRQKAQPQARPSLLQPKANTGAAATARIPADAGSSAMVKEGNASGAHGTVDRRKASENIGVKSDGTELGGGEPAAGRPLTPITPTETSGNRMTAGRVGVVDEERGWAGKTRPSKHEVSDVEDAKHSIFSPYVGVQPRGCGLSTVFRLFVVDRTRGRHPQDG